MQTFKSNATNALYTNLTVTYSQHHPAFMIQDTDTHTHNTMHIHTCMSGKGNLLLPVSRLTCYNYAKKMLPLPTTQLQWSLPHAPFSGSSLLSSPPPLQHESKLTKNIKESTATRTIMITFCRKKARCMQGYDSKICKNMTTWGIH